MALHLVAAGRSLDVDPETAYLHAQAALWRAGRVDVVREAAGLAAYATGRYAEALRELRTLKRLSGMDAHLAVQADCERGLGRPERALALISETASRPLSPEDRIELAIVASGARLDLGEPAAALLALEVPALRSASPELRGRVAEARAAVLTALGRPEAAARELSTAGVLGSGDSAEGETPGEEEEVVVFDLEDGTSRDAEPHERGERQ